jgi:hypothetical protein
MLFPVRRNVPPKTLGYVRSEYRARLAAERDAADPATARSAPWRDYPSLVLTDATTIAGRFASEKRLVISARNVLNEFGYRVRIDGVWWGRGGDPPLDPDWPVVITGAQGLQLCRLTDAESSGDDILTGIPLVQDGQPFSRQFLLAACSDVAHSYEVHPQGLIGPSAQAWADLANAWEEGKQQGLPDEQLAARLEAIAGRHHTEPSRNLLHSLIGQRRDGTLLIFGITGSLDGIARALVRDWEIQHAILLDNGGSIGWLYYQNASTPPIMLLAGPNHRPAGTVFLELLAGGFPQPAAHHRL